MDLRELELGGHKPGAFRRVGDLILEVYTKIALRKMSAEDKKDWEENIQEFVRIGMAKGRYCICQKCGLPVYVFEHGKRIRHAGYAWIVRCGKFKWES